MSVLPSIYNLKPSEEGGRIARSGFTYQDHVAVKCLLEMLSNKKVTEIWFETEDDIVILSENDGIGLVEMVQVKSNDLPSRWSVAKLIEQEIIEKSLQRGRCQEDVIYRISTLYDVDDELSILKHNLNGVERDPGKTSTLVDKITSKKPDIPVNAKGQSVKDWVDKCWWEKLPDEMQALKAQNIVKLEAVLIEQRNVYLLYDQRDELYQKLLALVSEAGLLGNKPNLNRLDVEIWLDKNLQRFSTPKRGTEKLVEKLNEAEVSDSIIEAAKDLKWLYKKESLDHAFFSQNAINKFMGDLLSALQNLKIKLDNGDLNLGGPSFHSHCIIEVSLLAQKHSIDEGIAKGCMYDITNRCAHRFTKAKP